MEMITTGISELDTLLGGGFYRGAPILFLTETGSMAEILALQILYYRLSHGDFSFIFDLDLPPERIREWFDWFRWDYSQYEKKDLLLLIDGFTQMFGEIESKEKMLISEPRDLVQVDAFLLRLIPQIERFKNQIFGVFFFSNIFLARAETPRIINLIYKHRMHITQYGSAIYLFDKGMLDDKTIKTLEHAFDFVIDFKIKQTDGRFQRYLRVKKSPLLRYIDVYAPYEKTPEKMVIRTGIIEDFESFKVQLKMIKDGYINLLGNRIVLLGGDYLSWLLGNLFRTYGYENIYEFVYSLEKERGSSFISPLVKEFKLSDLREVITYIFKIFVLRGLGNFEFLEFDPEEESLRFRIFDSPICSQLRELGKPAGVTIAGTIAGTVEKYTGKEYECEEVKCLAKGDQYCEFLVKPAKKRKRINDI
ncbi:MAG: V4R domain-containing protein [Candidatus Jordarchaeum sp.]|uniref:V4R domain-containing protein n=1 Tax=Candidatus Jordarchaeum sp. TaxID=2823881 RepID=UPI00404A8697